ncbi:S8 family serine peptidase, partial [bacterium]|nr:S8 family serine peptidase [bacterium]
MNRMVSGTALAIILLIAVSAASPRTWVYFTDKGHHDSAALRAALQQETERLHPRTKARLLKARDVDDLITERDLPVSSQYLAVIEELTGQKPHAVSRWLNAASFAFAAHDIALVKELPFAASVHAVRQYRAEKEVEAEPSSLKQQYRLVADSLFYGTSYNQNALENFPPAHEAGYTGEGVLVGMLDAGWNNLAHVCFDSLEIVATWDFVNGDSSVADDPGQPESGSHGTKTLSCMAGFEEGELIGTAYGISVALAKTENTIGEMPIEEDNWAAGIEWLDSLGCQVATSSVSYTYFDDATGYDYDERDGDTAVITIAGDYAVSRGIVVLNSNGNKGGYSYPDNKMSVPADGDSVLACGAVYLDSTKTSFSSLGPTYDGRIKPD